MSTQIAADFFEKAYSYFRMAENTAGQVKRFYTLAGHSICLRFAGNALVPQMTAALEHLASESHQKPEFTICLADSHSSRIPLCLPRWQSADYSPRGEVFSYSNDQIDTIYNFHTGALNLINAEKNTAIFWAKDYRCLPWWISGSPLQRIINCWMMRREKQLTHAAAIGTAQAGILLAGKSGSGKSTTSLACLAAGLKYVSEDYCLISSTKNPSAYSVYNSAKLTADTLERFPELQSKTANPQRGPNEKAFLFQQQLYPEKLLAQFPIRAVLLPKITNNTSPRLKPASIIDGLLALAPSTLFQLSNCGSATLKCFRSLLTQVPCYHLELCNNLPAVAHLITQLIEDRTK